MGVTIPRIIAIALSLSLTGGLMILFRASHPPAGATTLMVSLGILAKPWQLEVIMGAVVLLTLFAILFNRFVGIPYPLWKTVSHEVGSRITVESSLWACSTGAGRGEGSSDISLYSNGQFSKREGLSRIKRTHVRLVPLEQAQWLHAGWYGNAEKGSHVMPPGNVEVGSSKM